MQVAVIGHGKSAEGRGWGSSIDNCDIVLRMWDWHWQPAVDYGTKYDYGFLEINRKQCAWFEAYNCRIPTKAWAGAITKSQGEWTAPGGVPCLTFSNAPWVVLGLRLGGIGTTGRLKLTRGCSAACWMIERLKLGDELILVGFDNIYKRWALTIEEGYSGVYRAAPSTRSFKDYQGGGTKYHNHDYVAEANIIEKLARNFRVTLTHAQDLWK